MGESTKSKLRFLFVLKMILTSKSQDWLWQGLHSYFHVFPYRTSVRLILVKEDNATVLNLDQESLFM